MLGAGEKGPCPFVGGPTASPSLLSSRTGFHHLRKNKSIPVDPVRVFWVEGHEFVEQDMGHWGHAHRGTGMTGVGFESGIDLIMQDGTVSVRL